jgi:fibronectin type 3 domain-containing protein
LRDDWRAPPEAAIANSLKSKMMKNFHVKKNLQMKEQSSHETLQAEANAASIFAGTVPSFARLQGQPAEVFEICQAASEAGLALATGAVRPPMC